MRLMGLTLNIGILTPMMKKERVPRKTLTGAPKSKVYSAFDQEVPNKIQTLKEEFE